MATASEPDRRPLRHFLNETSIPEDRVAGAQRLNLAHRALNAANSGCIPHSTHRSSDAISSESVDSGYASTSNSDGHANRAKMAPKPSLGDKDATTSSKDTSKEEVTMGNWPLRIKLKCFQHPVPTSAQDRLVDFKVLFAKQLVELVSKYSPSQPDISLQLRWFGRSENDDLSLFLVVQCDKAAARAVKRFFNQDHVLEQFESEFSVHVLARPPKRLGTGDMISVWATFVEGTEPPRDTICGMPVFTTLDERSSFGTLGGVVMTRKGSDFTLYGMTSAHIFKQLQIPESGQSDVASDDSHGDDDDQDEFELELSELDTNQDERAMPDTLQYVGQHKPTNTSYDWGLVDLNRNFYLPNKAGSRDIGIVTTLDLSRQNPTENVYVLSGNKEKRGVLTNQTSSLLIGLGNEFIETYDLTLSENQKLSLGDSGSWVVTIHQRWAGLIGYVVGVNAFGDGYVVPMQTAMHDIKMKLQVDNVFLPIASLVESYVIHTNISTPPAAQYAMYSETTDSPLGSIEDDSGQSDDASSMAALSLVSSFAGKTMSTAPTVFSEYNLSRRHSRDTLASTQQGVTFRSPQTGLPQGQRRERDPSIRSISPPVPNRFSPRVSFDTSNTGNVKGKREPFSLALNFQHSAYKTERFSRTFMVILDNKLSSLIDSPLQWLLESLVDDGDEIVCLRKAQRDLYPDQNYRTEATTFLDTLNDFVTNLPNEDPAVKVRLEYCLEELRVVLPSMIQLYAPSLLIMGAQDQSLGGLWARGNNAFTRECLRNSPIPVVVVRPEQARLRGKDKRASNPKRHTYAGMLVATGGKHEVDAIDSGQFDVEARLMEVPERAKDYHYALHSDLKEEEEEEGESDGEFEIMTGDHAVDIKKGALLEYVKLQGVLPQGD